MIAGRCLVVATATALGAVSIVGQTQEPFARNVILFIGDGMGDSEITIARNYAVGAAGRLAMDSLAHTGAYTTYSVQERQPALPNYVTDSAASATAWATGAKTSNGRLSTAPATGQPLKTSLEIARARGYLTGDVTTAELTDATPAALASHVASRSCQGPADMQACAAERKGAGGPGSVAEQEIEHDVDVLFGGGRARFEQQTEAGPTVIEAARARGYLVFSSASELASAKRGARALGLFAVGNMTTEWSGIEAMPYPSNLASPQVCETTHRPDREPSLSAMTEKAIALLDRASDTGPGFFLQVEGASIDKQDHAADPCGQIGETVAFDRAIKIGLDFAHRRGDTLVVVTADHAHSSQIISMPSEANPPIGLVSALMTADRVPMIVSYGTAAYHKSQDHTGTQVRIAADGPGAGRVVGVLDQTDLFRLIARAMAVTSQ